VPLRFTGKIAKLTYKLGPEQLTEADRKEMRKHIVRAKDQASASRHRKRRAARVWAAHSS